MSIGSRISKIRKSKGITQQQLSKISGVDYNTLRKIETEKTKNPSPDFIEKIAKALNIETSRLLEDPKPNIQGGDVLPFLQLSEERFENLIAKILKYDKDFDHLTIQIYAGRGDKQRDVIAKRLIQGKAFKKYTLFQAKRYQKIDASVLNNELKGIKKHFFSAKSPTPVEEIVFCLANSPSATIKDNVKEYALSNKLPEPIFWCARDLDKFCKSNQDIMNEFFGGHIEEVKAKIDDLKEITLEVVKLEERSSLSLQRIESKLITVNALDDAEMQKARRLISEEKYEEAKVILLQIKSKVEHSNDPERLKKLYNNLGLCFSRTQTEESLNTGIEYLKQSLDLDKSFSAPKQNLIEIILNNGLEDQYNYANQLALELYEEDSQKLEYIGLYIYTLSVCKSYDKVRSVIKDHEKNIPENETLFSSVILFYSHVDEMDNAKKFIDLALKNFPDSVFLNRFKGISLMSEATKLGTKFREFDILPFFQDLNLVEDAVGYFKKALELAKSGPWSSSAKSQLALSLYNALLVLRRSKINNIEDLNLLQKIESDIKLDDLSTDEKKDKLLLDASRKLEQERNFSEAFNLFKSFLNEYDCKYEEVKDVAKKFFQNGSPEFSIKILSPLLEEAKEKQDVEYWIILSICYVLIDDKNSALRVMNSGKSYFNATNKEAYKKTLSHFWNLAARYRDNSESERLVKNIFELQNLTPEEDIVKPMKAIEDDGSLSDEIKEIFSKAQKGFEEKRNLFESKPLPIYSLKKIFGLSFPECVVVPSENYDFEFVLPYNALDKNFIEKQKENFEKNDFFVLDYSSLLNFSRCGQLGLLSSLGKKILASEYLLFEVQADLISYENRALRDAWNFLRGGEVKLFAHREIQNKELEKLQEIFDPWLIQEMDYCIKENAVLITDDLRLWHYLHSKEIGAKANNSYIFLQEGFNSGALDRKQYSLALAELADVFYHFIPFNGEDLMNIVLDDFNRIRNKNIACVRTHSNNFKVTRRTYHLLNQVKLPGSDISSFLSVSLDFLSRLVKLGVTDEEKTDWVLYLTNFFGEFLSDENLKSYPDLVDNHLKFIVKSWILLIKSLPVNSKELVFKKAEEIKNDELRNGVKVTLKQLKLLGN